MAVAQAPQKTTKEEQITDEDLIVSAPRRVQMGASGWRLQEVATSAKHDQSVIWLGRLIGPHADDHGILTASQAGFRMASGNVPLPDFAFTRYDRFPTC